MVDGEVEAALRKRVLNVVHYLLLNAIFVVANVLVHELPKLL